MSSDEDVIVVNEYGKVETGEYTTKEPGRRLCRAFHVYGDKIRKVEGGQVMVKATRFVVAESTDRGRWKLTITEGDTNASITVDADAYDAVSQVIAQFTNDAAQFRAGSARQVIEQQNARTLRSLNAENMELSKRISELKSENDRLRSNTVTIGPAPAISGQENRKMAQDLIEQYRVNAGRGVPASMRTKTGSVIPPAPEPDEVPQRAERTYAGVTGDSVPKDDGF